MSTDSDRISIEFNNRANDLFFSYLRDFKASVRNIDRKRHEYQFVSEREKYVNGLHQQLELIAKELLRKYQDHPSIDRLSQQFGQFINTYREEFVQHIRAL